MTTLYQAEQAAREVREMLLPEAERVAVAGSVRRGKPDVRDLEIVCVPKRGARPVWGEPASGVNVFEALIARLVRTNQLTFDPALKRNGAKYKRLLYTRGALRLPVDLFITDPSGDNFGNIMAIRTGDADFSKMLVLKESAGGLMPRGYFHHEGYLKHLERGIVSVPTEEAYFAELGLPLVPPAERNLETVERLLRGRVSA